MKRGMRENAERKEDLNRREQGNREYNVALWNVQNIGAILRVGDDANTLCRLELVSGTRLYEVLNVVESRIVLVLYHDGVGRGRFNESGSINITDRVAGAEGGNE